MINDFRGDYRWLSNFHLVPIRYQGIDFPSTEHAYQAMKSFDHNVRLQFSTAAGLTCKEARQLGQEILLRADWSKIRDQVMEDVLRLKFAVGSDLAQRLISTDDEELCEGNRHHDCHFGICHCDKCGGIGENRLGIIQMMLRSELQSMSEL